MKKVDIVGVDTSALPKMTNAETIRMLEEIKNGNNDARDKFIFANMRLVLSVMQKYVNVKTDCDDIFQVGCIGLIKAIDNFDKERGVRFSTYAVPMIIGEIRRFLRDESGIRVSRSIRDTAYRALQAAEQLGKILTREITAEEIANEINMPLSNVFFALSAIGSIASLDDPIGSENDTTLVEQTASSGTATDWLSDKLLKDAVCDLARKEREILLMRYFDGKTQMEVSQEIGISQAQVSRLEKTALDNIKSKI
jgi:RNA polymerase sporulation-specific sigma factor